MKELSLILISILFIGCNNDAVKQTQELNKNLLPKKEYKTVQKASQQPSKSEAEKIIALDYNKKIELEKTKVQSQKELTTIQSQNKQKIKELEVQSQEKLAQIKANKEQKIKELETKAKIKEKELEAKKLISKEEEKTKQIKAQNSAKIEIAKEKENTKAIALKEHSSTLKTLSFILFFILAIWLLIRYLDKSSKRRHEAELKEKELQQQAYMEETKLKHESLNKMLDIISDPKHDPEVKKDVSKILSNSSKFLLENKEAKS